MTLPADLEKRRSPRARVQCGVQLTHYGAGSASYSIENFSRGGLFLKPTQGAEAHLGALNPGDMMTLTVRDDRHDGDQISLTVNAVRIAEPGLAARFSDGTDSDTLVGILEILAEGVPNDENLPLPDQASAQLWNSLVAATKLAITHIAEAFLEHAPNALLEAARTAPNIQQDILFEVLERINKESVDIKNKLLEAFSKAFPKDMIKLSPELEGRQTVTRSKQGELSLLDDMDFDHWLSATGMVTKLERRLRDPLRAMTLRVSHLAKHKLEAERVPLGPNVLGRLLIGELITPYTDHVALEQELVECLEDTVSDPLAVLYDELNSLLEKHGYSAEAEAYQFKRRGGPGAGTAEPETAQQSDHPGTDTESPSADHGMGSGSAAPPGASSPPHPAAGSAPQRSYGVGESGLSGPAPLDYLQPGFWERFNSPPTGAAGPTAALGASRAIAQQAPAASRDHAVDVVMQFLSSVGSPSAAAKISKDVPVFADQDILRALEGFKDKAPRALARLDSEAFNTALRKALGPPKSKLIESQHRAAIASVFELLKTFHAGDELSARAKTWFKQLLIPLLKTAVNDHKWLAHDANPARDLVNDLGRLDRSLSASDRISREAISGTVEGLLGQLQKEKRQDLKLLTHVARIVHSIAESQAALRKQHDDEIVGQLDEEDQQVSTARAVDSSLLELFGDEPVPRVILDLLDAGWMRVLTQAFNKRGEDSAFWEASLRVINNVLQRINSPSETSDHLDMRALAELKFISRGLQSVGVDRRTARKLSDAMATVLLAENRENQESLPLRKFEPSVEHLESEGQELGAAEHWLQFCKQMPVGTELELHGEDGPRRCRLLWTSADGARLALADRESDDVQQIPVAALAAQFQQRSVAICNEPDLPLVDQGLYRLLHRTYDELAHHAAHDQLTSVLNRKEFSRCVEQAALQGAEPGSETMLCHIDIDEFQLINTTCGLEGGDEFLRELAQLLSQEFPSPHRVGRIGGDEFGILSPRCGESQGMKMLNELRAKVDEHGFKWQDTRHSITLSIGTLFSADTGMPATQLLKNADSARSVAKSAGGNRIHVYGSGDAASRREKLMGWVARIDDALHHDRLTLRCQRIEPIANGLQAHYEVLLGIKDKQGLSVPPDRFIAAAETFNRMQAVDRWIITRVFALMRTHATRLDDLGGLSINLSGISLSDENFCEYLLNELYTTDIRRDKVIFEITETAAISDMDKVIPFMSEIRQLGCRFALDDFGTGLTSYAYLRNLPVDFLKIDGCFIRDLAVNADDAALVKSINEIGHFMSKEVIAEYVENDEILDVLRKIGVDYAQGFGIEKPCLLTDVLYA